MSRGYFEIGIVNSKTPANLGTLWRSAYQLGAAGIFVTGKRYVTQPSDTCNTWKHIPLRHYFDTEAFLKNIPYNCALVGVEMGGKLLKNFTHPERAIYILGAEDSGLPTNIINQCQHIVSLQCVRSLSYNVAVAGSLVMYDRMNKSGG
jgi:tRNA G18 (ribose-2'-O)-methylase SpoU